MDEQDKEKILLQAQIVFEEIIATNHIKNTQKLVDLNEFKINPFLVVYLANFLTGDSSPKSIAKALIYPRVLGTSITTSLGSNMQKFTTDVLSAYGSAIPGIDIEFIDQIDNIKKYCQLKAGPNTLNSEDVIPMANHFGSTIKVARTNNNHLNNDNMMVGVLYGTEAELSANYKRIRNTHNYLVAIGGDFWTRLTGDDEFYSDLIKSIGEVAIKADFKSELDEVIEELAKSPEIIRLSSQS